MSYNSYNSHIILQQIQLTFARDWYWARGTLIEARWELNSKYTETTAMISIQTGPTHTIDPCALLFLEAITMARDRVWIASPYFVPDRDIENALILAALRGVDVRIILPRKPDHLLVWLAAMYYTHSVAINGVKIYRYQKGFLHSKTAVIDDMLSLVGTANLDNRSFRLNFEMTAAIIEQKFNQDLASQFENDLAESIMVTQENCLERNIAIRLGSHFARLFAPVL